MIIDFHTHTFPDKISSSVVNKLGKISHTKPFTDGSVHGLVASMKKGGVDYAVNLPVMTNVKQVEKVNQSLIHSKEELFAQGILTFGGMHPDYENYKQELHYLKDSDIQGIKIHPAYQNTNLDDIKMMRIIDYASELGLIVITHAGIDIGIYDHNYASVKMILKIIDEIQPPKFVLAHMGNWGCWNEVETYLAGAPVYFDTAFSIGTITPNPEQNITPYLETNLANEDFVRIARKHGTDKVLFATDSPWENHCEYIQRIQNTNLTEEEKEAIFSKNAMTLLNGLS